MGDLRLMKEDPYWMEVSLEQFVKLLSIMIYLMVIVKILLALLMAEILSVR
jgi:hypothetical protein